MNYVLIAYKDKVVGNYFTMARDDLASFIQKKGFNILNPTNIDCSAEAFITLLHRNTKDINLIFYSHGDECSIIDGNKKDFLQFQMCLDGLESNIIYSTACETAKGRLKDLIRDHCNIFYGYNEVNYLILNTGTEALFIECDNFVIKQIINGENNIQTLLNVVEIFFQAKINECIEKNQIIEAAFLMHNKESIEIH